MDGDEVRIRSRREMIAAGAAADELRRWLKTGELSPVRPGWYAERRQLPATEEARHLLHVRAALTELAADAVLSHVSAAVVHGFPTWALELDRVHVTRPRRTGGRVTPKLHVHTAALDAADIIDVGGLRVTSPARTVVDLARSSAFDPALVVADAALFLRAATPEQLDAELERAQRRPGSPAARRIVRFADGRAESPGESLSRIRIAQAGLPAPSLQWEVTGRAKRPIGRVDFGWESFRTVGEFDGRVKYGRLLKPGQQAGDVVWAEKVREDAIRAEGLSVVRWTWADLWEFTPVVTRLRQAFT